MVQTFWMLAFLLGLMKTRLDFFHRGMDGDKTWWIEIRQSFIWTPILPLPSPSHVSGPGNAFLSTLWQDPISTSSIANLWNVGGLFPQQTSWFPRLPLPLGKGARDRGWEWILPWTWLVGGHHLRIHEKENNENFHELGVCVASPWLFNLFSFAMRRTGLQKCSLECPHYGLNRSAHWIVPSL